MKDEVVTTPVEVPVIPDTPTIPETPPEPLTPPAPGPVRVTVLICRPEGEVEEEHTVKFASNHGDKNGNCHWFITRQHTICGQWRQKPLLKSQLHTAPPCPNGNPACPKCTQIFAKARREQYGEAS